MTMRRIYRGVNFDREIVDQQMGAGSVAPAPKQCESEEQNVAPIEEERGAAGRSALYPATRL
jgi:hypothetical protein